MADAAPVVATLAEERVSVASNWKLVWWRFRKNRLAVASGVVLILFYVVVLFPDFFATHDPEATEAYRAFIPVPGIDLRDAGVPAVRPVRGRERATPSRFA